MGLVTLSAYSHPGSYYWTPSYTYLPPGGAGHPIRVAIFGHPFKHIFILVGLVTLSAYSHPGSYYWTHFYTCLHPGGTGYPVRLFTPAGSYFWTPLDTSYLHPGGAGHPVFNSKLYGTALGQTCGCPGQR